MSKSIMIDPGHGGTDNGASGFGVREKDWALEVSLYQYKRLKELGAKVGITRTDDRTLTSGPRTRLIKDKYDLCVSNHWNAFNGEARGIETIHSIFGGKEFAQDLANKLVSVTGLPLRRVFTRKNNSGTDYYYMHRMTGSTRTVIVEYGFIDNRQDNDWYKNKSNFTNAAESVIEVICKHIGIKYAAPSGHVKAGWIKNNTGWWYRNADGSYPKSKWEKISNEWYYFNNKGYMETGWIRPNKSWYYLNANGEMQTGWTQIHNTWFYMDRSGRMQTGWLYYRKNWFYLDDRGGMRVGWYEVDSKWYYFNEKGYMQTGLLTLNDKHYFLQRDGVLITDEVVELEANRHGHLK